MCGVQMQFSSRSNAWPCSIGSASNTSTAAIPGLPRFRAAISASASISSARDVLTSSEVGFMRDKSSSRTMPRVSSFRRRCRHNTSHWEKMSSRVAAAWNPSMTAFCREAARPHTTTFMPKALP